MSVRVGIIGGKQADPSQVADGAHRVGLGDLDEVSPVEKKVVGNHLGGSLQHFFHFLKIFGQ